MRRGGLSKLLWLLSIVMVTVVLLFIMNVCKADAFIVEKASSKEVSVEVVSVPDADTVIVNFRGCDHFRCRNVPVRFLGIDAPEMRTRCAAEKSAAHQLQSYVEMLIREARSVTLSEIDGNSDPYGRLLAIVNVDGVNLSAMLLKSQLVRTNHGEKRKPWCNTLGEFSM